jgi:hypothetical protein
VLTTFTMTCGDVVLYNYREVQFLEGVKYTRRTMYKKKGGRVFTVHRQMQLYYQTQRHSQVPDFNVPLSTFYSVLHSSNFSISFHYISSSSVKSD